MLDRFKGGILPTRIFPRIERLDELEGDADSEVTEQDNDPEVDDEPEEDEHGGGNVEDEGENVESEDAAGCGLYGINQTVICRYPLSSGPFLVLLAAAQPRLAGLLCLACAITEGEFRPWSAALP